MNGGDKVITSRNRLILGQSTQSQLTRNSEATTANTGGGRHNNGITNQSDRFKKNLSRNIIGAATMTQTTQWESKGKGVATQGGEVRSSLSREGSFNRQSNESITNIARCPSPKKGRNASNDSGGFQGGSSHAKKESNASLVNFKGAKRLREPREEYFNM